VTEEIRVEPDEWDAVLDDVAGPQLVVGGPGTGKTEFLVRRADALAGGLPAGPAPLLLAFSRRGVADMIERLRRRGAVRGVEATTFHSLASRLLERYAGRRGWRAMPALLSAPEQTVFVRDLLGEEPEAAWPLPFRQLLHGVTFADEVTDFVLRCREHLIDADRLRAFDRADWRALPDFLDRYDAALREAGRIDYGTLLTEAIALLEDEDVAAGVAARHPLVLVDEYQDTTAAQVRFLRLLVAGHGNLTAAADPRQAIYSFRGADLRHVASFATDFGDLPAPPRRLVLTTSFRLPAAILAAAERLSGPEPGAPPRPAPAPGPSAVEAYRFTEHGDEAEWIAEELQRLHLEERVPYAAMAVLTRSKRRLLPELSRAFDRRGIPHDRPDVRLAEQPAVRFVLDAVTAATTTDTAERDLSMRRILLGPLFRMTIGAFTDISHRPVDWPAVLREQVPGGADLATFLEDPSWATRDPAHVGLWRLWVGIPQLADAVARHDEELIAAWRSLAQVLEHRDGRTPGATLRDYLALTEDERFEASPLLAYRPVAPDHVTVTTLHQAKGLRFEVVVLADAVEGVFPDLRPRDALLQTRRLADHVPTAHDAYLAFRLEEERRLAYTALTRARRRVIWTATESWDVVAAGRPSRFLLQAMGAATAAEALLDPPRPSRPVGRSGYEAHLRLLAADPGADPARRLAAVRVLAAGATLGLRDPVRIPGVRLRGPDGGLVPPDLRLSPSQAEAYALCPRRYVLERRLGVGAPGGAHAEFGRLVHTILERVEAAALARGDARGSLREALEALEAVFDPARFGGEPFAGAWHRRAVDALTALYGHPPSDGAVVAVEHDLPLRLGGASWRGRADRIERRDGHLVVVDYKTSRSPMSVADAAGSLQLGYYLLAARNIPIDGRSVPTRAEAWYPLKPRRDGSPTIRVFDPANLPAVEERLARIAAAIRREHSDPTPGTHCRHCPVTLVCPATEGGAWPAP